MSGIKTSKETYRTSNMQITFKLLKVKNAYEKVLEEVPCNLQKCQIKSTKKEISSTKIRYKIPFSRKPWPCRNEPINLQCN